MFLQAWFPLECFGIFYYVSLTPCIEYKYKRRRKHEAKQAEKAEAEIVSQQPGLVRQPRAFQTNEQWAEELMLGPGPPKGWKGDESGYRQDADNGGHGAGESTLAHSGTTGGTFGQLAKMQPLIC